MVKINIKSKNNNVKKPNKVIKTIDTVVPISTPVGSVHFDEFLKICRDPKLIKNTIETATKTKNELQMNNKETEKAKKNKKTERSKKTKKNKKTERSKKTKKNKKTEKSKTIGISKVKEVVKPDDIPLTPQPTLFPLIKALLLPSEDDAIDENPLFSVSYIE